MKYIYNECISPAELLMVGWQFNSQIHSSADCTLMQSDILENSRKKSTKHWVILKSCM